MIDLSRRLSSNSLVGKAVRLPLRLLPDHLPVKILQGPARGAWWLVGGYNHGIWLGTYERLTQAAFAQHVRSGHVVYDIGANSGIYTVLAAMLVGPAGHVVAFEPLPRNVEYLRRHVELNRFDNVTVIEAAVADEAGTAKFDTNAHVGMGHLSSSGALSVRVVAIDELIAAGKIPPADVMKIDVEGAGDLVLKGAERLIAARRPPFFFELHGGEYERCTPLLERYGYEMSIIDEMAGDALFVARP